MFLIANKVYLKNGFELQLRSLLLSTDDLYGKSAEELIIIKNQDNSLSFTISDGSNIERLQIFDVLGRTLFDLKINEQPERNQFWLNGLKQGIFVAKATMPNGKVLVKKGLR